MESLPAAPSDKEDLYVNQAAAAAAVERWGLIPRQWESRLTAKHIFTHVEWHMTGYGLEVTGGGPADFFWADGKDLAERAVPSAFARYAAGAEEMLARACGASDERSG